MCLYCESVAVKIRTNVGTKEKLIFNSKLCVIAQGEEMAAMDLHCFLLQLGYQMTK